MGVKIVSYPKLRRSSVLSSYLKPEEIKNFKALMERYLPGEGDAYLVHNGSSFILFHIAALPHDSSQVFIDTYSPADFREQPSEQEPFDEELWNRMISFLLYELFFIQKKHKLSLCIDENCAGPAAILEELHFRMEGQLREHFSRQGSYHDARLFALTGSEFEQYSTGIVPILDEYLLIRTTGTSVCMIDVLKRDASKPDGINDLIRSGSGEDAISSPAGATPSYFRRDAYAYTIKASREMAEYLDGSRKDFDLATEWHEATDFQKAVWDAARRVPYGQTCSYEEIAQAISAAKNKENPGILSRAVGTALSKNPVMILIPCHRIIGKDGKLRGFAGGLDIKDFLLTHEMTHYPQSSKGEKTSR